MSLIIAITQTLSSMSVLGKGIRDNFGLECSHEVILQDSTPPPPPPPPPRLYNNMYFWGQLTQTILILLDLNIFIVASHCCMMLSCPVENELTLNVVYLNP